MGARNSAGDADMPTVSGFEESSGRACHRTAIRNPAAKRELRLEMSSLRFHGTAVKDHTTLARRIAMMARASVKLDFCTG